jgi:IPTL-CTERM motif
MNKNPKLERVLERFEPGRRDAVRKILIGTAVYTAPVVASFSMDSLGGVAQAQSNNSTITATIPTTSEWSLVGLAAMLAAAGAYVLRRRRDR